MKRLVISLIILLLVFSISATAVFAGSATFTGTLDPSDPTMEVVSISTPTCLAQAGIQVSYDVYGFTVDIDGVYTFNLTSTSPPGFASYYVYEGAFDPSNGAANCIAGNNDADPKTLDLTLAAGTQYFLVVFDDLIAQPGGTYSATISGVGNISDGTPGDCPFPLPLGSVVYNVPAGAPAFFAADLSTQTNFTLAAGTWYISEFSGDFAKVWIACEARPFWIPTNAVAR